MQSILAYQNIWCLYFHERSARTRKSGRKFKTPISTIISAPTRWPIDPTRLLTTKTMSFPQWERRIFKHWSLQASLEDIVVALKSLNPVNPKFFHFEGRRQLPLMLRYLRDEPLFQSRNFLGLLVSACPWKLVLTGVKQGEVDPVFTTTTTNREKSS